MVEELVNFTTYSAKHPELIHFLLTIYFSSYFLDEDEVLWSTEVAATLPPQAHGFGELMT